MNARLPYDFYTLHWCESTSGHTFDKSKWQNKDYYDTNNEKVNDYIHESPYTFKIGEPDGYKQVCMRYLTEEQQQQFQEMVRQRYRY